MRLPQDVLFNGMRLHMSSRNEVLTGGLSQLVSIFLNSVNFMFSDERMTETVPNEVAILDEEPDVGKGLAGALRLAVSKGYLEKETINRPSASRFAHLQAQNYSIDDKAHG